MADIKVNIHTLDKKAHRSYLQKGYLDPVTHEPLEPGDKVVFCAVCELGFIYDSWVTIGQRHCGQSETLDYVPVYGDVKKPKKSIRLFLNTERIALIVILLIVLFTTIRLNLKKKEELKIANEFIERQAIELISLRKEKEQKEPQYADILRQLDDKVQYNIRLTDENELLKGELQKIQEAEENSKKEKENITSVITSYFNALKSKNVRMAINTHVRRDRTKHLSNSLSEIAGEISDYSINAIGLFKLSDGTALFFIEHNIYRNHDVTESLTVCFKLEKEEGDWRIASVYPINDR
ncbi:MAG: hypothetical protein HQL06_06620 [Nitrospirae bacterium]|nr:hypothetical protein [Nitrospirota bacterium]